jgi:hypothetical protein
MNDPRFPIGRFHSPETISPEDRARFLETIAAAPLKYREAVAGLSTEQLDTPYREGGWTVRQVIHHVPDSHMNAYVRFKLALTENDPTVKPYDEAAWADLKDVSDTPVETSLSLLDFLHQRWVMLMRGMPEEDWKKRYIHPESNRPMVLDDVLAMYAWHCDHHLAHVRQAISSGPPHGI